MEDSRGFFLSEYNALKCVSGPSGVGDRFEQQGNFTKYMELFCRIQEFNRDMGTSHTSPRRASCSLSHWMQASSVLEDVRTLYAKGLGTLTWAHCCRQRSCTLIEPICLNGSFFFLFSFSWVSLDMNWLWKKPSALLGFSMTEVNPWNKIGSQDQVHPWLPLFLELGKENSHFCKFLFYLDSV